MLIHWFLGHPQIGERILVVCSGDNAIEIAREILGRKDAGYRIVGFVDNEPALVGKSLLNPKVIVEVLSESTEAYDRGAKFAQYRTIPSLEEYVLVSQTEPQIERYLRQPDGGWMLTDFVGLEAEFRFATVPAAVALAEVYRDVTFPDRPPR